MVIWLGVLPGTFLRPMDPSVNKLIERVTAGQPTRVRLDDRRTVNPDPAPAFASGRSNRATARQAETANREPRP